MNEEKITVAIVEDTDDIREALRVLINGSLGFECLHVFPSAEEALEKMPAQGIDVVLMDIGLPGISGIECMKALKPRMPDTQFMISTVYDDDDYIFNALQSGATGYMLKRTPRADIITTGLLRPSLAICPNGVVGEVGSSNSSNSGRCTIR